MLVPILFRQRQLAELLIILFWPHSALVSARHVPLYVIVAAPICAVEASRWWAGWSARFGRRSIGGTLRDCLHDFSAGSQRTSVWVPIALLILALFPWDGPKDFPANKFPVAALLRNADVIAPSAGAQPRILTSDQWGDYLIYHLYPKGRVFVDGRSDFYGRAVGRQYLDLLNGAPNWESTVDANGFDVALLPLEWPLAQLLMRHPRWRTRYVDHQTVLLERTGGAGLNQKPDSTERIHGGQSE